jgi:hypothetical protein
MRWVWKLARTGLGRINGLTIGFLGISWSTKGKDAPPQPPPASPSRIELPSAEQVQRITASRGRYEAQRHAERELAQRLSRELRPARSRSSPAVALLVLAVVAAIVAAVLYFFVWRTR